jgi:hypothetical protein
MGLIKSVIILVFGLFFINYLNKKSDWFSRTSLVQKYKSFILLFLICLILLLF